MSTKILAAIAEIQRTADEVNAGLDRLLEDDE